MDFLELARMRYSCKNFDGSPVDPDELDAILQAGRLAPTAKNSQEQRVYVVQSQEGLAKIDELTPCRYGAPSVLVVAYDEDGVFAYPGGTCDSGVEDASIVATHMMLAAAAQGVDSCWVNRFDPVEVAQAFELPANEHAVMLLDLGHAADGACPLPNHDSRKDLTETVTYL